MVTLISVIHSGGRRERCDARCHNATHVPCRCCCKGHYHGKQEGTPALTFAVREYQDLLLFELGEQEDAGALWIEAFRASPEEKLTHRRQGKARTYQEPLLPE